MCSPRAYNLIALYPTLYTKEAFVLIRRLEFLKSYVQDVPISHSAALSDVATTNKVIIELKRIIDEFSDDTNSKFLYPISSRNTKYDNHGEDEDE